MADRPERGAPVGAHVLDDGRCAFRVWAPRARNVDVLLLGDPGRIESLAPAERGYFAAILDRVTPGQLYRYRLDGERELPDPAARAQPHGVHGPSAVVPRDFDWSDAGWKGPPLRDYIIYELHVGTFTAAGTFDAVTEHLSYLREVGITAIELMPVAEFPGARNWGYDGVFPFAAHSSYGGPAALKRLVDASHRAGLAVVLDVVYNHFGPEGNCLTEYGFYFTGRYHTPWGAAINLDGPHSDEVRACFVQNALQWVDEFRIDALRLDAVHALFDMSARPFLAELAACVREAARVHARNIHLIAESDPGDPRLILPPERGGYDLDALWLDDFHHALHTSLTGERTGYYRDFGRLEQLGDSFRNGSIYRGQYSEYRARRHGAATADARPDQYVVFIQNHDQVGNRLAGDRLAATLDPERLKLAAATVLLSPFVPLLFMGEEYGETAPFTYFVSHSDPQLIEAVRRGRRQEFEAFAWAGDPPDPLAEETFTSARIDPSRRCDGGHAMLLALHRRLIELRRALTVLTDYDRIETWTDERVLTVLRHTDHAAALLVLNFSEDAASVPVNDPARPWRCLLDSAGAEWLGPGAGTFDRHAALLMVPPCTAQLLVAET